MKYPRKNFGLCLTQNFNDSIRCEKCDLPIERIRWKDKKIALSTNRNSRRGFICLRCFTSPKVGKSIHHSEKQIEEFFRTKKKIECINANCSNFLLDFELGKLKIEQRPSPRYRFCRKCRGRRSGIEQIHCLVCNKIMYFVGQKIKCADCRNNKIPCYPSEKKLEELITN